MTCDACHLTVNGMTESLKLIVAITGATGAIHAVRLLQALATYPTVETHLVMTRWALANLSAETSETSGDLAELVYQVHSPEDLAAPLASGSFLVDGMIVVPCSMRTLAAVAQGLGDNLVTRAADVCLKEGRRLVLCPRETPLSAIHLENLLKLARLGVRIVPPMPAYYHKPQTIDDLVDHHVMKILDQFGLAKPDARRWTGPADPRS